MVDFLITGAKGFIGSRTVEVLTDLGHSYFALDRSHGDIRDKETWAKAPAAKFVLHLAGRSSVSDSWKEPSTLVAENLQGVLAALEFCKEKKAKLIFPSSYLYGNPSNLPSKESDQLDLQNPYALSKKICEDTCLFYAKKFEVAVCILRPFNVYGKGIPKNFLIPIIIDQAINGSQVELFQFETRRDYVHVDDLVDAFICASKRDWKVELCNIGSGENFSSLEIAKMVLEILEKEMPIVEVGNRSPGYVHATLSDITKAKLKLNWAPKVTMKEGLASMLRS